MSTLATHGQPSDQRTQFRTAVQLCTAELELLRGKRKAFSKLQEQTRRLASHLGEALNLEEGIVTAYLTASAQSQTAEEMMLDLAIKHKEGELAVYQQGVKNSLGIELGVR